MLPDDTAEFRPMALLVLYCQATQHLVQGKTCIPSRLEGLCGINYSQDCIVFQENKKHEHGQSRTALQLLRQLVLSIQILNADSLGQKLSPTTNIQRLEALGLPGKRVY